MNPGPSKHHRRSIRIPGFDYSLPGAYFVTVCAHRKKCIFGEIESGKIYLFPAGTTIEKWWFELIQKFPNLEIDVHQVMPNHFHGIVRIREKEGQPHGVAPTPLDENYGEVSLGDVVHWWKTMATNEYIRGVKERGWPPFEGRLLQRNYFEHIIRNEEDLERIRHYIRTNVERWTLDRENPDRTGEDEFDLWLSSFSKRNDPPGPTDRA